MLREPDLIAIYSSLSEKEEHPLACTSLSLSLSLSNCEHLMVLISGSLNAMQPLAKLM